MFARSNRLTVVAMLFASGAAWSIGDSLALARMDGKAAPPTPPRAAAPAPRVVDETLPIKKITLYRSGVGYFERSGEVSDNAEVQLRFNTDQINDILKSLVMLDLGGGRIDSVSYGSKEPLAKRLASFGLNISDNPGAAEILQRLRGTPVKLTMPEGEFSGTIMNVEQRPTVYQGSGPGGPAATVHNLPWINLVSKDGVKSYNLSNCSGFQILDANLADELNKALDALAEYRADRNKTVDLRFTGVGTRRVVVGYVYEMPVWKTSYRVILPDLDTTGKASGQLSIQGWAIVENTTDQDWNNVQLSLVSGRPVSYQMDLYEPLFSARPWINVPTIPGVAPRIFGLGIDSDELTKGIAIGRSADGELSNGMQAQLMPKSDEAKRSMTRRAFAGAPAAPGPGMEALGSADKPGQSPYAAATGADLRDYAAQAAASGQSIGEVFQFQVDAPVSVDRQRSAMIPILSTKVTGRRVSIFNSADGSQFPMRGVELTNDSDSALLPGPISVFDGAAYAGDAQIGQIPKGDKRMLAYALDLEMAVLTKPENHSSITKVTITNGALHQSYKDRLTTTYEFANKDTQRGRTLILEHPKHPDYELIETDKPTELTPDLYRFTLQIDAAKAKTFTVTQERTRYEDAGIVGYDMPTLLRFRSEGKLSDQVMDAVRKAMDKQNAITATERAIAENTASMDEISKDQTRIRENMARIDHNGELYKRYVTKLTDQETQLENLREQQSKSQKQLTDEQSDLNEYLRTLNVD